MPLFTSKKFNPTDAINDLVDQLNALKSSVADCDNEKSKKSDKWRFGKKHSIIDFEIQRSKLICCLPLDQASEVIGTLCHEIYSKNVIILLIHSFDAMDLEVRKNAAELINDLVHHQVGVRNPTVDYLLANKEQTIFYLVKLYNDSRLALHVGLLLRDFAQIPELCQVMLQSRVVYDLTELMDSKIFDISADAHLTLRQLLTCNKKLVSEFLETNYEPYIDECFNKIIASDNYVAVRQSLKLLCDVLMDPSNLKILVNYVSSPENLKRVMILLSSKLGNIQYEAFHIFKAFVANPDKPEPIKKILMKNFQKLIDLLLNFQPIKDISQDEKFDSEIKYLIRCLEQLQKT